MTTTRWPGSSGTAPLRLSPQHDGNDETSCGGDGYDSDGGNGYSCNGYDDDEMRRWLGFQFFFTIFILIFTCGRHNHPTHENAIFVCGCATCMQKMRFLQTLGDCGPPTRTRKPVFTTQENPFPSSARLKKCKESMCTVNI
jgi:hypothetical protein